MPTITRTIKVRTDANGSYSRREIFDAPTPFPFTIELKAKLLSPEDTIITGTLDCDAADGKPQNPSKDFTLPTGKQVSLGEWKLDGGDNILLVSGQTSPMRSDTEVQIELEATF